MQQAETTPAAQVPADKPRQRRWVWRCTVVVAAVPLLIWLAIFIDQQRQPVYERVGEWFDEVCGLADPQRIQRASVAGVTFTRMDSNAVPFLVQKLRTLDSPLRERFITRGRGVPFVGPLFYHVIPPTHIRLSAAYALKMMGDRAESAIPALMVAIEIESNTNVTEYIVAALARISGAHDHNRDAVLRRVRQRYPHLFPAPLVLLGPNAVADGTNFLGGP